MPKLHDMHCHLDFIDEAEHLAEQAREAGTMLFANTVTPEGWLRAQARFGSFENVRIGFGMHPWWAAGEPAAAVDEVRAGSQRERRREEARTASERRGPTCEEEHRISEAIAFLERYRPVFIGEVGLDFGWRHLPSRLAQEAMFERIARWAARQGARTLSLHSIKSARETLDALDRTRALDTCTCIFHWFSGPSDLLKRAIDAGCYFSCGKRMLDTRKGREYVKAIPAAQLLLETDAPPERGMPYPYGKLHGDLESAAQAIATIKGPDSLEVIAHTAEALLQRETP